MEGKSERMHTPRGDGVKDLLTKRTSSLNLNVVRAGNLFSVSFHFISFFFLTFRSCLFIPFRFISIYFYMVLFIVIHFSKTSHFERQPSPE